MHGPFWNCTQRGLHKHILCATAKMTYILFPDGSAHQMHNWLVTTDTETEKMFSGGTHTQLLQECYQDGMLHFGMYIKYVPLLRENSTPRTLPFKYKACKLTWKYFFKPDSPKKNIKNLSSSEILQECLWISYNCH